MNSRERIQALFRHEVPDRVGLVDSPWGETVKRWRREGFPSDVEPADYFGYDCRAVSVDWTLQFPENLIEETDEHRVYVDSNGITREDLRTQGGWTPHWLDHPIKTRDDWERLRGRLVPNEARITQPISRLAATPQDSTAELYQKHRPKDVFLYYSTRESYEAVWPLLGQATTWMAMLDDPAWMRDMFHAHADLVIGNYELMRQMGLNCDGAQMAVDLGYKGRTFFRREVYRELLFPEHRRICDYFHSLGMPVMLHSCGYVRPLVPDFVEAGFDGLNPLEVKAGMDLVEIKETFGDRLVIQGGLDVRTFSVSREAIEEEVKAKVPIAKRGGGYIFASDHSLPNNVSLDNYQFVVEMAHEHGTY
ncbi:MAG: hypothetical protein HYY04_07085 [Chloroflexi bacterium]|nr:hypothetical protein [Chloroflexota bacterium]